MKSLILNDYLPYRISIASNSVSSFIAHAYEIKFGLSIPMWRIMAVMGEKSPVSQQDIVSKTLMDKVTVSRAVNQLLSRRLVVREFEKSDKRVHALSLSPAGVEIVNEIVPSALEYERKLIEAIGEDRAMELKQVLKILEAKSRELEQNL